MLGILLIYFIWKNYSELAFEFNKSRWGYALLGIASYYGGTIIAGFIIGLTMELIKPGIVESMNEMMLNLICVPFGILTVWGLHKILEKRWRNAARTVPEEALDSDFLIRKSGE